jgi:hypothetical protein
MEELRHYSQPVSNSGENETSKTVEGSKSSAEPAINNSPIDPVSQWSHPPVKPQSSEARRSSGRNSSPDASQSNLDELSMSKTNTNLSRIEEAASFDEANSHRNNSRGLLGTGKRERRSRQSRKSSPSHSQ